MKHDDDDDQAITKVAPDPENIRMITASVALSRHTIGLAVQCCVTCVQRYTFVTSQIAKYESVSMYHSLVMV